MPSAAFLVAAVLATYLEASVPIPYAIGRARGLDLREAGTGNPGTANLFRNAGWGPALVAGPLSFVQGLVPLALARVAGWPDLALALLALAAVLGNGYSWLLRFHGGRIVATGFGAMTGLWPPGLVVYLVVSAVGYAADRLAVSVLVAFALAPLLVWRLASVEAALGALGLLVVLLLRRLDGIGDDLQSGEPPLRVVVGRLILDAHPGQALVGPRRRFGSRRR